MKKNKFLFLLLVLLIFTASLALVACEGTPVETSTGSSVDVSVPTDSSGQPVATLTLNKSTVTMGTYDTFTLTATYTGEAGELTWKSSAPSVASVEGGVVSALSEGIATITASVGSLSSTCAITVVSSGAWPTLFVGEEEIKLFKDQEYAIHPTLKIKNNELQGTYAYESSAPSIATVTDGKVKALSIGETTVSVIANYNGFETTKTVKVTVTSEVFVDMEENDVVLGTYALNGYATEKTVTANVYVDREEVSSPVLEWATEDGSVATVEDGVIKSVGAGKTIVTATYLYGEEAFTVNVYVTVEKPILSVELANGIIDLKADTAETVEIDLSGIDEEMTNLVKITNKSDYNRKVTFTTDGDRVYIARSDFDVGNVKFRLEYKMLVYDVDVKVTCDRLTLISYNNSGDTSKISIRWGTDLISGISNDIKYGNENGSLKLTFLQNGNNYMKFVTTSVEDVSDYDYVVFNVFNPTGKKIFLTYLWTNQVDIPSSATEWTEARLPISKFAKGDIKGYDDEILSATKIGGLPIYLYIQDLSPNDSIYFSSLYVEKKVSSETDPARANIVKAFDNEVVAINLPAEHGTAEYTTERHYDNEKGSLKLTVNKNGEVYLGIGEPLFEDISAYDYLTFYVYNPTSSNISVGTFWFCDTVCAPGQWTQIKITAADFASEHIVGWSNEVITMKDISPLVIRFISGFKTGDVFYVSAVKAEKAQ